MGRVIGVAGAGLEDGGAGFAANAAVAEVGRRGEIRTAGLLNDLAETRAFTVVHDLRIPIPGWDVNVDHAVVSGNRLLLIDSKVWKPAFYWTVGGKTRRGLSTFEPADKHTMKMARTRFEGYLEGRARVLEPIITVWSSSKVRTPNLRFARPVEAQFVHGGRQIAQRVTAAVGDEQADERIISRLIGLVADRGPSHTYQPLANPPVEDFNFTPTNASASSPDPFGATPPAEPHNLVPVVDEIIGTDYL